MITKLHITRWFATLAVALSLPVVIAYAQEVTSDIASSTPEIVEQTPDISLSTSTEPVVDGEVMGTSTEATSSEPAAEEPPAQNSGEGSSDPTPEPTAEASTTESVSSSTPEVVPPVLPVEVVASTTASSTEVIVPQKPVYEKRTVFIQTSVDIKSSFKPGLVNAEITLANQTCRSCESKNPAVTAVAYVSPWYENRVDAVVPTNKLASQTFTVLPMAGWATSTAHYVGEVTTPGKYYFTVVVDPANEVGAHDMYRTEFLVE